MTSRTVPATAPGPRSPRHRPALLLGAGATGALLLATLGGPSGVVTGSPPPASAATCAGSTTYQGTVYCPGYLVGVRSTAYGVGTRLVLRGLTVVQPPVGRSVVLAGGPSCLPGSDAWGCGQTIPTLAVTFPTGLALPSYGDVLTLYGVTVPHHHPEGLPGDRPHRPRLLVTSSHRRYRPGVPAVRS